MFSLCISSPVPYLKCLAQAVQKLWPLNRNPRWRPTAILDFDFWQFWSRLWMSIPLLNFKTVAQTIQKLWPINWNPRWQAAAILDFFFQFS